MHDVALIIVTALPSFVVGALVMRAYTRARRLELPGSTCTDCGAKNPPPAMVVDPNATQLCMTCGGECEWA